MEKYKFRKNDVAILAIMFPILLICLVGSMFIAGAYVTPWALEIANCAPRSTKQEIMEFSILIFSMIGGYFLSLLFVKLVSVIFVSQEMFQRWKDQMDSSNFQKNGFSGAINRLALWALNPER